MLIRFKGRVLMCVLSCTVAHCSNENASSSETWQSEEPSECVPQDESTDQKMTLVKVNARTTCNMSCKVFRHQLDVLKPRKFGGLVVFGAQTGRFNLVLGGYHVRQLFSRTTAEIQTVFLNRDGIDYARRDYAIFVGIDGFYGYKKPEERDAACKRAKDIASRRSAELCSAGQQRVKQLCDLAYGTSTLAPIEIEEVSDCVDLPAPDADDPRASIYYWGS